MKTVGRVGLFFPMLILEETKCKLLMSADVRFMTFRLFSKEKDKASLVPLGTYSLSLTR